MSLGSTVRRPSVLRDRRSGRWQRGIVLAAFGSLALGGLQLGLGPASSATEPEPTEGTTAQTFVLKATGDTWVQSGLTSKSQHTSPELRVGTKNAGLTQAKSYLTFDTSALGAAQASWIVDARVSLSNFAAGSCSGSAIRLSQVTKAWSLTGLTWGTQPTVTAAGASTNDKARGATGCATEGVVDFDATAIVRSWVAGAGNHGVQLASVKTGANGSYRGYRSLENGDPAKVPTLTVTVSQPPETPTDLAVTPAGAGDFITSTTPTLSATVSDPDGGQVRGYFEVTNGATVVWSGTSTPVASGGTATIDVPAGKLTDGSIYTVSAWGQDDVDVRSATPAFETVIVDSIAPSVSVASATFTNGQWSATLPSSDTLTLDGSGDTGGFHLDLDGSTATVGADSQGDKTLTYTPSAGWHVLKVTPVDRAGNLGEPVTFSYGAGAPAFTKPAQWTASTASFPVDFSGPAGASGATLEWRLAGATTWRSATKVTTGDGTAWQGAVTGTGRSTTGALTWNATQEPYNAGKLTGPALLELRGCFQYAAAEACTTSVVVTLNKP